MGAAPIAYPSPAEFVARAVAFGLLVVAGLVASIMALLSEEQAASWRASRPVALTLAALSVAAIVAALVVV